MKILISAAETSSDAHGAELLRALREQAASSGAVVDAFGVGGPKLQAMGLRAVVDARELLAMGFLEILSRLPRIFSALKMITEAARVEQPEVAVVLDYPDFHFRLARRLKAQGIPVIYYIPPKVWVWRKSRIHALRDSFVKILSILPFEEEFYKREGVPVKYVGSPLVDELPLNLTRDQARAKLGLGSAQKVLVLMPGSRPSEVRLHLELMLNGTLTAATRLRSQGFLEAQERLVVLMPFPVTSTLTLVRDQVEVWVHRAGGQAGDFILDVRVSQGDAPECLVAADSGLIKSGTSTLEAGMLGCPHAIVFKPNRITEWIFKYLIRYKGPVGLANLVAGWSPGQDFLVKEILCGEATVPNLSDEIVTLFVDAAKRQRLQEGFRILRARVLGGSLHSSPSGVAAREILSVIRDGQIRKELPRA